jgi:hypothetical protein
VDAAHAGLALEVRRQHHFLQLYHVMPYTRFIRYAKV